MTDTTPIYGLPEIVENQGSKNITHNISLRLLEALNSNITGFAGTPPAIPVEGQTYVISGGSGVWSGRNNQIAVYVNGFWEYMIPNAQAGPIYVAGAWKKFNGSSWVSA